MKHAVKISFILIALLFISCQGTKEKHNKLKIVTTIYPYELIVKQLVGDKAEVTTLIPANASPHTYNPLPNDIKKLAEADLVISNGMDLEEGFEKIFEELKDKHLTAFSFLPSELILREDDHDEHQEENRKPEEQSDHHHAAGNPHLWTDPEFIVDIARGITKKLNQIDPINKKTYDKNLEQLEKEINLLNENITIDRKRIINNQIILFHDSFAYFNNRYDIHTAAVIEEFPGKEPSPAELMKISKIIKEKGVKAIFTEPQLNPKAAQIIAREFNLKLLTYDPLGTTLNVTTISEYLQKNWELFKQGLE